MLKSIEKYKIYNVIILMVLLVINPLLASLISTILFANNQEKRVSFFVIIIFFFCYGWTFIPASDFDIVRHQEIFEDIRSFSSFSDLHQYTKLLLSPDVIINYVYWFLGLVSSNSQIIGAVSAVFFYGLMYLIIDNFFTNYLLDERNLKSFLLVLGTFFALTVTWYFSGMRNGNAVMLFIFLLTSKNLSKKSFIYDLIILLPGFIHFTLFPISGLLLACKYFNRTFIIGLSILFICINPFIESILLGIGNISSFLGPIGSFISAKLDSYIITGTDASMYTGAGFRYYLVIWPIFIITPLVWLFINRIQVNNQPRNFIVFHNFIILFFGYSVMLLNTYVFSRNLMVFGYVFVLYIFYFILSNTIYRNKLKLFLYMFVVYITISIIPSWYMGKEYLCINKKLIYGNVCSILRTKVTANDYWL